MLGISSRIVLRTTAPRYLLRNATSRRTLSTAPPSQKPRSWKSSAARWGLAVGLVWYYSTSDVFAEEPAYAYPRIVSTEQENKILPTLDDVAASRQQKRSSLHTTSSSSTVATPVHTPASAQSAFEQASAQEALESDVLPPISNIPAISPGSPEELEEEADSQGAFNEETGEINWDCPCLGGMAHGPCGGEFREAFSCFVYSKEEPKGVDCIERFKGMQDCFRLHPDVYGAELSDDPEDEDEDMETQAQPAGVVAAAPYSGSMTVQTQVPDANLTAIPSASPTSLSSAPSRGEKSASAHDQNFTSSEKKAQARTQRAKSAKNRVERDIELQHGDDKDGETLLPKAAHDAREQSTEPSTGKR